MKKEIEIGSLFPCKYSWQVVNGHANAIEQVLHFPDSLRNSQLAALNVRVEPEDGSTWLGVFYIDHSDFSAVYSMPNPLEICVVSNGDGYIVNVEDPTIWQEIPLHPVRRVIQFVESNLLICHDFTDIMAYNINGVVWDTGQFFSDDVEISQINSSTISGTATKDGYYVSFVIDINTGTVLSLIELCTLGEMSEKGY